MREELIEKYGDLTLEEYQDSIVDAMATWVANHTDRDTWFNWWTEEGISNCYPNISNGFFSFNVKDCALKRMAEDCINTGEFVYCEEHGIQSGYDPGKCDCYGDELSVDDLIEYFEDVGIEPAEGYIQDAIYNEGFDAFYKGTYPAIADIVEDTNHAISEIEDSVGEDRLVALQKALSIAHLGGRIVEDYAGVDSRLLDMIRNDGILSVFTREEVDEFIKEPA